MPGGGGGYWPTEAAVEGRHGSCTPVAMLLSVAPWLLGCTARLPPSVSVVLSPPLSRWRRQSYHHRNRNLIISARLLTRVTPCVCFPASFLPLTHRASPVSSSAESVCVSEYFVVGGSCSPPSRLLSFLLLWNPLHDPRPLTDCSLSLPCLCSSRLGAIVDE